MSLLLWLLLKIIIELLHPHIKTAVMRSLVSPVGEALRTPKASADK